MNSVGGYVLTDPDHLVIAGVFQAAGFKALQGLKGGSHHLPVVGRPGQELVVPGFDLSPGLEQPVAAIHGTDGYHLIMSIDHIDRKIDLTPVVPQGIGLVFKLTGVQIDPGGVLFGGEIHPGHGQLVGPIPVIFRQFGEGGAGGEGVDGRPDADQGGHNEDQQQKGEALLV